MRILESAGQTTSYEEPDEDSALQYFQSDRKSISGTSVFKMPVKVAAEIPLKRFCIRDLLSLKENDIVSSDLPSTEDIPFMAGGVHLAWSEFDVINHKLVSRLTRLIQDSEISV